MSYQRTNHRLLIRPRVKFEESLQSYLIRLARANGYQYSAFISGVSASSKPCRSFKPEDRRDIKALISKIADTNAIKLVDVWEYGSNFRHLFDWSRIKVCPKCYESDRILPPYWWLKNYLACGVHKLLLVDSCSKCNQRFREESFVKGNCLKCGLEIESNKTIELDFGIFDKKLHDIFKEKTSYSNQFRELISDEVEQIYAHYQICSYFLKEVNGKNIPIDHRRTLDINDLYSEQEYIQKIIHDGKISQLMYNAICTYQAKCGKTLSQFITPMFKLVMSHHGYLYKTELINLLIKEPNNLEDWTIGINWFEKLLTLEANALKDFVKEHYPNLKVKNQGPFAIRIRDLNYVLAKYSKYSEFKDTVTK